MTLATYKIIALEEFENYREEIGNDIEELENKIKQINETSEESVIDKCLLWLYSDEQCYVDELKEGLIEI